MRFAKTLKKADSTYLFISICPKEFLGSFNEIEQYIALSNAPKAKIKKNVF